MRCLRFINGCANGWRAQSATSRVVLGSCVLLLFLTFACLLDCGGDGRPINSNPGNDQGGGNTNQAAIMTVTLSDPVVCISSQGGPFQHIYITITDVQAYRSAKPPLQNGVDLTPGLSNSPMQVDLLGVPGRGCALATLGSSVSVAPGTYQAVQLFFAGSDQVSKISGGTKCPNTVLGLPANCAVLADGSAVMLDEGTSGSFGFQADLSYGEIVLSSGAQVLNIDFDSCASMVFAYAGEYAMDPTLHAALLPSAGSITGKLLDASTQHPIAGDSIVALEQADASGVYREIMQTSPGADGSFVLCPVPPGMYTVVATGVSQAGVSYVATVTTAVQAGDSMGNVPLQAVGGGNRAPATVTGQITAMGPMQVGGYTHVLISALQGISTNQGPALVTIPLPSQYTSTFRTIVTSTGNFKVYVPAGSPLVGAFVQNGKATYQQNPAAPSYQVDAQSSCNPATVRTPPVSVSPGNTSVTLTIALVECPPA